MIDAHDSLGDCGCVCLADDAACADEFWDPNPSLDNCGCYCNLGTDTCKSTVKYGPNEYLIKDPNEDCDCKCNSSVAQCIADNPNDDPNISDPDTFIEKVDNGPSDCGC